MWTLAVSVAARCRKFRCGAPKVRRTPVCVYRYGIARAVRMQCAHPSGTLPYYLVAPLTPYPRRHLSVHRRLHRDVYADVCIQDPDGFGSSPLVYSIIFLKRDTIIPPAYFLVGKNSSTNPAQSSSGGVIPLPHRKDVSMKNSRVRQNFRSGDACENPTYDMSWHTLRCHFVPRRWHNR